jgi:DNA-directed RNA polymerase specialized sigma24 family protein
VEVDVADRERDRAEFSAFVQRRQHRLLRAAYLIVGDERLAEDLLQNALIKLADRWSTVRDGNPEAYLRTILYRDAVSWWRRHRRERLVPAPPEPPAGAGAARLTLPVRHEGGVSGAAARSAPLHRPPVLALVRTRHGRRDPGGPTCDRYEGTPAG